MQMSFLITVYYCTSGTTVRRLLYIGAFMQNICQTTLLVKVKINLSEYVNIMKRVLDCSL